MQLVIPLRRPVYYASLTGLAGSTAGLTFTGRGMIGIALFGALPALVRHLARSTYLILLLALAACSHSPQPDLAWMYGAGEEKLVQPPLVIIPGLMGTRLHDADSGEEVWPGSIWRVIFNDYHELIPATQSATESGKALRAGRLTDQVAGRDFYGSIIRTLEDAAGYRRFNLQQPVSGSPRQYYVFTYDWRQDLQRSAAQLDDFLENIRRQHGDDSLTVDIVAHSMGGLIARYYLRFGAEDVLNDNELTPTMAGARKVRRTILLGTPNLGSVEAVRALIEGRRIGLRTIKPEVLAAFPSMIQLFPHAITDWLATSSGKPLSRDQFDIRTWQRFKWGLFDPEVRARMKAQWPDPATAAAVYEQRVADFARDLERARRFIWSLTVPVEQPVPLVVFGGDCGFTPARLVVEEVAGVSRIRFRPRQIQSPQPGVDYQRLMLQPGDGIVTKASLLARSSIDPTVPRHRYANFPLDYAFLLCARHDRLTANVSFQDNLLDALLRPAR